MSKFDEYSRSYKYINLERRSGILQMTLHTDGGPLQWGLEPQEEFVRAFGVVGADLENRLIISSVNSRAALPNGNEGRTDV